MADRYCGNCGHELAEDDQFCRNCGRPVHETARVATPEADVSVPPPPQQAGAAAPPQQAAAPTQGRSRGRTFLLGCLGIIGILILLGIIGAALGSGGDETAGGGGGGAGGNEPAQDQDQGQRQGQQAQQSESKPKPQPEYKVGQTATVANVQWKVTDAYLTNQLRSGFGTQKRGRFVVVDFTFTNNRDEEVTLDPQLHMILRDAQGREFGPDPDAWEFVPNNLNIFLEPVNPGLSKAGRVVYQVGPDARGFKLIVDDVELMEDESAVFNLTNIGPRTYDTASPTASATAGQ